MLRFGGATLLAGALAACTRGSELTPSSSAAPTTSVASASSAAPTTETAAASSSSAPTFSSLSQQISGGLLQPGDRGYRPESLLYNPRFAQQRPPQAIAMCRSSVDVQACVRFCADSGIPLRIRNGGHSYGGWSSGPGLVANLAELNALDVDTAKMTAKVGAGALLADVYTELDAKGVSIGAGSCPTVGITGLTLGGGVGVLTGAYGLACDQLAAVDLITADGRLQTVSATTQPDLFWALRGGGGGSFGAVTALTFRVRPAPTIGTYYLQWPWRSAAAVLTAWQHWIGGTARELWSTCKLLVEPGRGQRVVIAGTWLGTKVGLDAQLQPLLGALPPPVTNTRTSAGYAATMLSEAGCSPRASAATCIAGSLTPARRQPFSATSSILRQPLPAAGVAAIVAATAAGSGVPGMVEGGVSFDSLGGAVDDLAPTATAFPWRGCLADLQYTATWSATRAAANPAPYDAYVQRLRRSLTPWLGGSAYLNYADPTITAYPAAYWDGNLPRLQQVKRAHDPHNLFSFPQSVPLR
ncbi:FAD/FMN-containing dehydrogenase [Jatrophihabitans sp. GAS493]|nr:FAD/FMN-containing dehydrogenase [Jatrophihabitans sp. GAS493]